QSSLKKCIMRRDFIPASAICLLLSLKLPVPLYSEVDFPPCPAKWVHSMRLPEQQAQTTDKGHGRVEIRSIRVASELKGYSDWPGLEQVFEIRRRWRYKGEWREEVRYGITSLPATVAIPQRLLKLKRGHWTIENR